MPVQKPGKSKQDYQTPVNFMHAVAREFGAPYIDLAASRGNAQAPVFLTEQDDSLSSNWHDASQGKLAWINPPFAQLAPWVQKCVEESQRGCRILLLVPAGIGTIWFRKYAKKATVYALAPRLTFVGETAPYPKDLMLCHFRPGFDGGFGTWQWK